MKCRLFGWSLCAVLSGTAHAKDGVHADYRGLTLTSGSLALNLGGRLQVDAARFDDPAGSSDEVTKLAFRRARLELSGRLGKAVRFRIDREFAGRSKGWRNLWLSVEPRDNIVVKAGNFIVPFSAEDLQSSNTLPFAELSLVSALTPGYGLGASISASGKSWTASGGFFTNALNNAEGRSSKRGNGVVGRFTVTPVKQQHTLVHLGMGVERRTFNQDATLRFSADAGSALAPSLMSTGRISHLDHLSSLSGEAAGAFGSFLVQGTLVVTRVDRDGRPNLEFNGQNLQGSWLMTGGTYSYSSAQGVFDGPALPRGKRAVELAARISRLDLNSGPVQRGTGQAVTAGLNWYLNRNVRLMADYTASRVQFPDTRSTIHDHVAVGRVQVAF